jgi:hypothetical protein
MKCENSAFNAQGSRLIVVVLLHAGAVKIFVGSSSSGGAQEKGKEGMKLSLQPKLVGKTSLGPSYFVL